MYTCVARLGKRADVGCLEVMKRTFAVTLNETIGASGRVYTTKVKPFGSTNVCTRSSSLRAKRAKLCSRDSTPAVCAEAWLGHSWLPNSKD